MLRGDRKFVKDVHTRRSDDEQATTCHVCVVRWVVEMDEHSKTEQSRARR